MSTVNIRFGPITELNILPDWHIDRYKIGTIKFYDQNLKSVIRFWVFIPVTFESVLFVEMALQNTYVVVLKVTFY